MKEAYCPVRLEDLRGAIKTRDIIEVQYNNRPKAAMQDTIVVERIDDRSEGGLGQLNVIGRRVIGHQPWRGKRLTIGSGTIILNHKSKRSRI